ncbi:MAG: class I SAM-dependent methyltransferase [Nanoarchaeota archaeon]|nr:class I SAM-dependent methyltransferase [Nanoarchaeota archaeon]
MGDPHLKEVYDDMSRYFDEKRTKKYFYSLVKYLKKIIPPGSNVLEIGSGTGGYCIALAKHGCKCKGVDYSEKMVEVAIKNNKAAGTDCIFKVADVEKEIPFKEKFDFIISMDSWEFFPKPKEVLKNVNEKMKPSGLFLIFTPSMLFALPIIAAEKLKIKKLSPAYTYFNSFKYRVRKFAREGNFRITRYDYIFNRMTIIYYLRKKIK